MSPIIRKVLAQRKFAQGANIPLSSTTPERRIEPPNTSKDKPNIILSNMTAKSLLDTIIFKDFVLSRLQPTVVLDRLKNSQLINRPKDNNPMAISQKPNTRSKTKRIMKSKCQTKTSLVQKRIGLKRRTSVARKQMSMDDFSTLDDNKPLTHFAKNVSQSGANVVPAVTSDDTPPALNQSAPNNMPAQIPMPSTSKENNDVSNPQNNNYGLSKGNGDHTAGYYGAQKIQEWMEESINQESPTREVVEHFAEMTNKATQTNDEDALSPENCQSLKYNRIAEILLDKNKEDYESRCHRCHRCKRIVKLSMLRNVFKKVHGRDPDIDELENNAAETEDVPEIFGINEETIQPIIQPIIQPSAALLADNQKLYLDLSEQVPQVIQISRDHISSIVHAKLVPRNECQFINDFCIIRQENLLDKLLSTLRDIHYEKLQGGSLLQLQENIADEEELPIPSTSRVEGGESSSQQQSSQVNCTVEGSSDGSELNLVLNYSPSPSEINQSQSSTEPLTSHQHLMQVDLCENIYEPMSNKENTLQLEADIDTKVGTMLSDSPITVISDAESIHTGRYTTHMETRSHRTATSRASSVVSSADDTAKENEIEENLTARLVDAPVFYPTSEEFQNPIVYINKIMPEASKFGICKVVAPQNFKPTCNINDEIRFKVVNQYIARLFSRWGPASQEMCAIKAHLATEKVTLAQAPLVDGMEVNLPKLYNLVKRQGGLGEVIKKRRWGRLAEQMGLPRSPNPNKKIERVCLRFLLSYSMLSQKERRKLIQNVSKAWRKKNTRILMRSSNPLHRKKRLLGDSESSGDETEEEEVIAGALAEAEDCVATGRSMSLSSFKKIAKNTIEMYIPNAAHMTPTTESVEAVYWQLVSQGTEHVSVNTASIDTGDEGYGFTKDSADDYSKHPWNLKMLSQNKKNVLRFLGPVLGVTVPTLHLGMVFSTSCWHRDPHGLPWIEYMHQGPGKIWYGIPRDQSSGFRRAIDKLCPSVCQSKPVWLPSDVTMVPPELLLENRVPLSRVVQHPGEFIIVFPKAYSCSISTGLTISESVYFAADSWLNDVLQLFKKLKFCCEPTMFSLERLLVSVAKDPRVSVGEFNKVRKNIVPLIVEEQVYRDLLKKQVPNITITSGSRYKMRRQRGGWNTQEQDECEICRATHFFAKVTGLTRVNTSVCLEHAVRLLSVQDEDPAQMTLFVYYTDDDLKNLLSSVEKRAAINK